MFEHGSFTVLCKLLKLQSLQLQNAILHAALAFIEDLSLNFLDAKLKNHVNTPLSKNIVEMDFNNQEYAC